MRGTRRAGCSRGLVENADLHVDRLDDKVVAHGRVGIGRQAAAARAVEVNTIEALAELHPAMLRVLTAYGWQGGLRQRHFIELDRRRGPNRHKGPDRIRGHEGNFRGEDKPACHRESHEVVHDCFFHNSSPLNKEAVRVLWPERLLHRSVRCTCRSTAHPVPVASSG